LARTGSCSLGRVLDTLIVGGGLSGLALASLLKAKKIDCRVYEARERLGGRVSTLREPNTIVTDARGLTRELPGRRLDCGATWFWPADNPLLSRLLDALGIATFEQYETGRLVLASAKGRPRRATSNPAYASARRIVGGAGAAIEGLAARVGEERIRLGHELLNVVRHDDYIELGFRYRGEVVNVRARRVALAMPPRLLHAAVDFSPKLSVEVQSALAATPTWMASRAKALARFPEAFWRRNGDSGAALASYPDAVLGEVFDASDANGRPALGGFFALGPHERRARAEELPELIRAQLVELFGPLPDDAPASHIQDWACERFTATLLDLEQPASEPTAAPHALREPLWERRLFIAGTETGNHHAGHMEGALEAALRVASLLREPVEVSDPKGRARLDPATEAWLEHFHTSARARRSAAADVYRDEIARSLSAQDYGDMTQRALLEAARSAYRGALKELAPAPFLSGTREPSASAELVEALVSAFAGFSQELIAVALKFNQTSCAMRAFPDEARPGGEYLVVLRNDLRSLFEEFERQIGLCVRVETTSES
ncbi:MAG TPA: FAD-dependent oxidoreductase, partial [Polyangiaceae bacterium]|nr:FAD-dependent oxidoreductase [Polyangiaceae bacterium]